VTLAGSLAGLETATASGSHLRELVRHPSGEPSHVGNAWAVGSYALGSTSLALAIHCC